MPVSDVQAAQVLARCARHCCICRQFNPLLIQVHHIVPKEDGGRDTLDNIIAVCIACHAYLHTSPTMTRKFTTKELHLCRKNVYELVEQGKLPAKIPLTSSELQSLSANLAEHLRKESSKLSAIPQLSVDILVAMIAEDSPVKLITNQKVKYLRVGNQQFFTSTWREAGYPDELSALIDNGFLRQRNEIFEVTESGRDRVMEITRHASSFTMKKAKCMQCSLHFIICTDQNEFHRADNIFCPECGQHNGRFILWSQKQIGFIFEYVPGRANVFDVGDISISSAREGREP